MPEEQVWTTQREIEKTRALYEAVFTEDTEQFVDYYYEEKTRNNKAYTLTEKEQVVAMLHLNPFWMKCRPGTKTRECLVYYVVAVATALEHRHKGYMDRLLRHALCNMEAEGCPFAFLIPASPAIYEPYQFTYIAEAHNRSVVMQAGLEAVRWDGEDAEEFAEFADSLLQDKYCMYVKRTAEYYSRLNRELESQGGSLSVLKRCGKRIGSFGYVAEEDRIQDALLLPEYRMEDIFPSISAKPLYMARVLCLSGMGSLIALKSGEQRMVRILIRINDPVLSANHGLFSWQTDRSGSTFTREDGEDGGPVLNAPIESLTAFLFGYLPAQACFPDAQPELLKCLERIGTLSPLLLEEVV